ncbi:MAG: aldehyde dehydrogenase family protein [Acidobacteria bacterium]|nr:aldehyde dehydrogenase family protein [Acidobacteriota bacterium]
MSTSESQSHVATTSQYLLDRSVVTLRENAIKWSLRSLDDRIADLTSIRSRTMEAAPDLVADALQAKGIGPEMAGEEWISGPYSVLRTLRFLQATLEGIRRRGEVPLPDDAIRERVDGQVAVDVLPGDGWDRILYPGWKASVRMDPSIGRGQARLNLGGIYTKPETADAAVAVILGAGNVSSITQLDLVHKLFVDGHVAMVKFNPVNDYIGPYVEHGFADLIEAGFVRTSYGGAEVGDHLVMHPETDEVHITGSEVTHDAIVFGTGPDGAARKAANTPRMKKPITSELGNVSPVIVVPGAWSDREMSYQAEHVATQLLQNAGYNCNAVKVVVLPETWDQCREFMDLVGEKLALRPDRRPYYPGSLERYGRIIDGGGEVRTYGDSEEGLPPTIVAVEADADHPAFAEEAFCRIMATVTLPGNGPVEFLDRAVEFCNDRLRGTLNVTLLVDKATLKANQPAVDRAIDDLRYGTVGLNLWAAAGFPLGVTPWGAFPGHTLQDIGSGIGFVHNARLIDRPQKTVVQAPFVLVPKPTWSVFHGNSAAALRKATAFEARPAAWRVPGLLAAAVRV